MNRRYSIRLEKVFLRWGVFFAVSAMLMFLPFTSRVQAKKISLREAVEIAGERNLNLQAASAQLEAAYQQVDIAASNFLPRLNLTQNIIRTDQQVNHFGLKLNHGQISQMDFNPMLLNNPDKITDYGTSVVVQQPIFNGGKEILGYKMAKKGVQQAESETFSARETIIFETVKAYLGATLAREGLKVSEDALKTAEKNLEMIRQRYDQGLVIKSDLLQAQVHVAQIKEQTVAARHNVPLALAGLNTILGNSKGDYEPMDNLEGGGCPPVDLKTLTEWAQQYRSELKSLRAQEEAAELQVRMAQSEFLPNINAQGSYDYHGNKLFSDGADSITLALSIQLNLFSGTSDYHKVKQAKSRLTAIRKMRAAKSEQIDLEVKQAYWGLQTAYQRLQATEEAVDQAKAGLEIITQRYKEGAAGIVYLLRTELALANARFNRLQAQHDLLLENADLCRAVGVLSTKWLEPEKCPIGQELNPEPVNYGVEKEADLKNESSLENETSPEDEPGLEKESSTANELIPENKSGSEDKPGLENESGSGKEAGLEDETPDENN